MKTLAIVLALSAAVTAPAFAQVAPDQITAGVVRGLEAENSSGQVGEVADRGNSLQVVIKGSGGKPEAVTINRGFSCSSQPGKMVAFLGMTTNGNLVAPRPISDDHLLSGNYLVVVHNNTPTSAVVACGHLFGDE